MLDVGVVSMVDYQRLHKEHDLNFQYIGVDINESIVEEAKKYIEGDDEVHLWDIHNEPPNFLKEFFDVVLVKHMLHYCKSYEVLSNAKLAMKSSGHMFVVNNKNIYTSKNTTKDNGEVLYAFGQWTTTYSEKAYVKYLHKNFKVEHNAFSGKGKCKPYTVDTLRKPD
jgi:2-polyprenyl-3-methyl-5-hydroxy-6-metoxy-1,4-benzoquinol methylase